MGLVPLNKPRGYKPRYIYYDPDKEMHNEIVAQAKRDLGIKTETPQNYAPDIKGKFQRGGGGGKITFNFRRNETKKSNLRISALLLLMGLLIYLFFLR